MSSLSLAVTLNRQDHLSLQHHINVNNQANTTAATGNTTANNSHSSAPSYSGKLGSTDANLYLDKLTALENSIQAQKHRIRYFVFSAPFIGENAKAAVNVDNEEESVKDSSVEADSSDHLSNTSSEHSPHAHITFGARHSHRNFSMMSSDESSQHSASPTAHITGIGPSSPRSFAGDMLAPNSSHSGGSTPRRRQGMDLFPSDSERSDDVLDVEDEEAEEGGSTPWTP